jgi:gluconolactonase
MIEWTQGRRRITQMSKSRSSIVLCLAVSATPAATFAQEILDINFRVKKVAGGCKFTEGPAVDPAGNLFFSDSPNDRIMQLSPDGKLSVFRHPCGRANGLIFDHQGRLVMCQSARAGGGRSVVRIEKTGTETALARTHNGKRFIAPNDLCIDRKGRIYFTDPYYGPPNEKSQPVSGVYRIDVPGKITLVIPDLQRPNGIVITPDNRTVYVSDRGTQKLHRYRVTPDAALQPAGIVHDFSPDRGIDGMCLDIKGNIYAAAGKGKTTGLFVLSPDGKLLLHKPMPELSTNVTFGGKDMCDLYLTATTSVYKMRTITPGVRLPAR